MELACRKEFRRKRLASAEANHDNFAEITKTQDAVQMARLMWAHDIIVQGSRNEKLAGGGNLSHDVPVPSGMCNEMWWHGRLGLRSMKRYAGASAAAGTMQAPEAIKMHIYNQGAVHF